MDPEVASLRDLRFRNAQSYAAQFRRLANCEGGSRIAGTYPWSKGLPTQTWRIDVIVNSSTVFRTIFDANGFTVCGEAVDGRDAIERAQELRPDPILLDLSMPVMNGLEAARELKKIMPNVPLVMFTNHTGTIVEAAHTIFDGPASQTNADKPYAQRRMWHVFSSEQNFQQCRATVLFGVTDNEVADSQGLP